MVLYTRYQAEFGVSVAAYFSTFLDHSSPVFGRKLLNFLMLCRHNGSAVVKGGNSVGLTFLCTHCCIILYLRAYWLLTSVICTININMNSLQFTMKYVRVLRMKIRFRSSLIFLISSESLIFNLCPRWTRYEQPDALAGTDLGSPPRPVVWTTAIMSQQETPTAAAAAFVVLLVTRRQHPVPRHRTGSSVSCAVKSLVQDLFSVVRM